MGVYEGDPRTHKVTIDGAPLPVHRSGLIGSNQFTWGITGPGTTQLALAILMSVLGDMRKATLLAPQFALEALVKPLTAQDAFTMTTEQALEYITLAEANKPEIFYR